MAGARRTSLLIVIAVFIVALACTAAVSDGLYMLLSLVLLAASMVPFFLRFERRRIEARELVLLAVLAAIAAMVRVAFMSLPSVQPTTFVIIVAALAFGSEAGFIIGAVAAIVSNLFLGQGPWTPWQMFCWGMVGATAGWLRHTPLLRSRLGLCAFGLVWGFLFGWIMNIWSLISMPDALSWKLVVLAYIQSFYFDLAHALANVFFLGTMGVGWLKVLSRLQRKYGLMEP